MKLVTALGLAWKAAFSKGMDREFARYMLAERICKTLYPRYLFSDFGRIWLEDRAFLDYFERFVGTDNYHSADRKYLLRSLLQLVKHLPGDTAECGAYEGASSYLICEFFAGAGKEHHVFDSFEGLSAPESVDGGWWHANDLTAGEEILKRNLAKFPGVHTYRGWIPARFAEVADRHFCVVHIDVDLYAPTRDSLEFFYPRMVPGGLIVCDDYGYSSCPGAQKALDEFMAGKPEGIVHAPTGQGIVVKR